MRHDTAMVEEEPGSFLTGTIVAPAGTFTCY